MKRVLDLSIAGLVLLVAAVPMGIIALLIRSTMGRPVLFRQERPGLEGRPFVLLKFRTMSEAAGDDGRPLPDDRRLTRVGRFLRRTSLDELPQFWNVLVGEMSLVGPRPLLMAYLTRYSPRQARRHDVRPGITGWAQIRGRNTISWEEKFELDLWYVEHAGVLLDLRILAETIWIIVARRGSSADGGLPMAEFTGSSGENGTEDGSR